MSYALNLAPSNEACREAIERAFDAHYEGAWIDGLNEEDLRELMRKMWADRIHQRKGPKEKYYDMAHAMDRYAEKNCQAYAEKNWSDYLKG